MKKRLEFLEQMQEIDVKIDALKSSQKSLSGEICGIEQGLGTVREELAALQVQVEKLEQDKIEQEGSLAVEQENIRRSETNMKEIKTNKEFQAVGREITAARKLTTELEEVILQKLGQIEVLGAEIAVKDSNLKEMEQNSGQRRDEKQAEIDAIQKNIDSDSERRDAIISELPAGLVKRYVSLREQRRGQAVAIARDGYCLGCNMHLPPQLYNNLFRADELINCPHCQRILVLKHQLAS